jgi:hypothetical protein
MRTRLAVDVGDGLSPVLAEQLLEHLDFEEQNAGPTIRRMHTL